jgi:hypothetical protein
MNRVHGSGVRIVDLLEQRGDLEQVGAHRRSAHVQQEVASAADGVLIVCTVGSAAEPLGEDAVAARARQPCALAELVALAPTLH